MQISNNIITTQIKFQSFTKPIESSLKKKINQSSKKASFLSYKKARKLLFLLNLFKHKMKLYKRNKSAHAYKERKVINELYYQLKNILAAKNCYIKEIKKQKEFKQLKDTQNNRTNTNILNRKSIKKHKHLNFLKNTSTFLITNKMFFNNKKETISSRSRHIPIEIAFPQETILNKTNNEKNSVAVKVLQKKQFLGAGGWGNRNIKLSVHQKRRRKTELKLWKTAPRKQEQQRNNKGIFKLT